VHTWEPERSSSQRSACGGRTASGSTRAGVYTPGISRCNGYTHLQALAEQLRTRTPTAGVLPVVWTRTLQRTSGPPSPSAEYSPMKATTGVEALSDVAGPSE